MRLPKQWKHWLRLGRFKWRSCDRKFGPYYPYKNGRNYRVSSHGMWQIDDGDFDRWANSLGGQIRMPATQAEFIASMDILLDLANRGKDER